MVAYKKLPQVTNKYNSRLDSRSFYCNFPGDFTMKRPTLGRASELSLTGPRNKFYFKPIGENAPVVKKLWFLNCTLMKR